MRIFIVAQKIILVGILVSLLGCATQKPYHDAVRSWKGVPVQFLVQQWGKPTEVSMLANGDQYYLYKAVERRSLHAAYDSTAYSRTSLQGQQVAVLNEDVNKPFRSTVKYWCDTGFEINNHGVIVNAVVRGNNCVSTEEGAMPLLSGDQ